MKTILDLCDKGLTDLSGLTFRDTLVTLHLGKNSIDTIDTWKLPRGLVWLDVSDNSLTEIDVEGLPRGLQILNLSGNLLTDVDFARLPPTLQRLDLSNNWLYEIDASAFPKDIRSLNLSANDLADNILNVESLPPYLESLRLRRAKLSVFDTSKLPSTLSILDLSGNCLVSFDTARIPPTLTKLNLNNNPIEISSWTYQIMTQMLMFTETHPAELTYFGNTSSCEHVKSIRAMVSYLILRKSNNKVVCLCQNQASIILFLWLGYLPLELVRELRCFLY